MPSSKWTIVIIVAIFYLAAAYNGRTKTNFWNGPVNVADDQCESADIKKYADTNWEAAADNYLDAAIASWDTYRLEDKKTKSPGPTGDRLKTYNPSWKKFPPKLEVWTNFYAEHYVRTTSYGRQVLIAYRGTDSNVDWLSNFLIWNVFLLKDQYDEARSHYDMVVKEQILELEDGKKLSIVLTGHSLGGGLAQHVSLWRNCAGAVVFNSSFVTKDFGYEFAGTDPDVVHIYEKGDPLQDVKYITGPNKDIEGHWKRSVDLIPKSENIVDFKQHSIRVFSLSAARLVVCCHLDKKYGNTHRLKDVCAASQDRLWSTCNFYIKTKFGSGRVKDPICNVSDNRPRDLLEPINDKTRNSVDRGCVNWASN